MKTLLILIILLSCLSCAEAGIQKIALIDDSLISEQSNPILDSLLKYGEPVLGYRFVITGDFDGDKKIDTLIERFTDSTFQTEAPKYFLATNSYSNFDYGDVVHMNSLLNRQSFLSWKHDHKQHLRGGEMGFHYVENCGDLNFDGTDELLVVEQHSDWSNLNRVLVYTFSKGKWKEFYQIPIWEWQFPPTPSTTMTPSLFGNFGYIVIDEETENRALENQVQEFRFLKKYNDNSIEYEGRNPLFETLPDNFGEIGEVAYIKKHFKRKIIDDSLYLQDLKNPAFYYKATTHIEDGKSNDLLFIDDGAGMMTVRIYLKHPKSPFR